MTRRTATNAAIELAGAYSATADAWQEGPGRIYDRLAEVVVTRSPVLLAGRRVLDAGSGTGAAGRAALAAGAASVVALDVAFGMLSDGSERPDRLPPAVVGDVCAVPFASGTFDVVVAAFCLNHVTDPVAALRELGRVIRRGGALVAAVFSARDDHPAKGVVERVLAERGWRAPGWSATVDRAARALSSPAAFVGAARAAGLHACADVVDVRFPELTPADLVTWRLGMAHHAPFVAVLPPGVREDVIAVARRQLDHAPPLVRSINVLRASPR